MKLSTLLLLSPALLMLLSTVAAAAPPKELTDLFEKQSFTGAKGGTLPYRLLKPEKYDETFLYPMVVFLHGSGERGDDNEAQLKHGVTEFATPTNRKKYPCFVIAPQCPKGKTWGNFDGSSYSHKMAKDPSETGALVLELVLAMEREYRVHQWKVYLTGLSMGGFGTWDLLMRRPELFAAGVPVCGGGDEKQVAKITKMPIWVFHGALDKAVNVERSRSMVEALEKAGAHPLYTEYPDEGHECWVAAYRSPALMKWMFGQANVKLPSRPRVR